MENFDKEAFAAKFKAKDTEGNDRIDSKALRDILAEMDLDLLPVAVNKLVQRMDYYRIGIRYCPPLLNKSNSALNDPKLDGRLNLTHQQTSYQKSNQHLMVPAKEKEPHDNSDSDSETSSKPDMDHGPEMWVTLPQALKVADLVMNKIKKQIWMKTADFYSIQNDLIRLANRPSFAVKDPGHMVKVNVLVGEEKEKYNSFFRAKFQKKQTKAALTEEVMLKLKIQTSSLEEASLFGKLWGSIYEMIVSMVEGELPDGQAFLKTISVEPTEKEDCFQLCIKSHNPDLNQLLQLVSSLPNVALKTEVRINASLLVEFIFDLKDMLENPKASLYDILTNNIRVKFTYQGSEYVSAIKELMIAGQAFKDLSYVSDDEESLIRILLISTHSIDMNLKFKNGTFVEPEQDSLMMLLNTIKEQVRPMIQSLSEYSPELHQMAVKALKKQISLEVHSYDYHLSAELFISSLDRLLLEDAPIMENYDPDNPAPGAKKQAKKGPEQSERSEEDLGEELISMKKMKGVESGEQQDFD